MINRIAILGFVAVALLVIASMARPDEFTVGQLQQLGVKSELALGLILGTRNATDEAFGIMAMAQGEEFYNRFASIHEICVKRDVFDAEIILVHLHKHDGPDVEWSTWYTKYIEHQCPEFYAIQGELIARTFNAAADQRSRQ